MSSRLNPGILTALKPSEKAVEELDYAWLKIWEPRFSIVPLPIGIYEEVVFALCQKARITEVIDTIDDILHVLPVLIASGGTSAFTCHSDGLVIVKHGGL